VTVTEQGAGVRAEHELLEGHVHFMGVCGAGMSPLAELLLRSGGSVSGCDLSRREGVSSLESLGLEFVEGHHPDHLSRAAAVVVTSAVPDDHPEIRAAVDRGIPVLKRAEALGAWVNHPGHSKPALALRKQVREIPDVQTGGKPFAEADFWRITR